VQCSIIQTANSSTVFYITFLHTKISAVHRAKNLQLVRYIKSLCTLLHSQNNELSFLKMIRKLMM